jgi:steroid delta-isomerase-like uncharacterized protein
MTREEIAGLFARRDEALARRDAVALGALHVEDGVVESPTIGGTAQGRPAIVDVYRAWFTGFPDVRFGHEELLVEGDLVAQILTVTGTDTGGFLGLPPTDKPFELQMVSLCTIRDGGILRERRIYDFTGLLVQIGVLKARPGLKGRS